MTLTENSGYEIVKTIVGWIIAIVTPFLLGVTGWVSMEVIDHGQELAAMKANRFTSKDAFEMQAENTRALRAIKDSLHELDKKMPSADRMAALELNMTRLQLDVASMKQELLGFQRERDKPDANQ